MTLNIIHYNQNTDASSQLDSGDLLQYRSIGENIPNLVEYGWCFTIAKTSKDFIHRVRMEQGGPDHTALAAMNPISCNSSPQMKGERSVPSYCTIEPNHF